MPQPVDTIMGTVPHENLIEGRGQAEKEERRERGMEVGMEAGRDSRDRKREGGRLGEGEPPATTAGLIIVVLNAAR